MAGYRDEKIEIHNYGCMFMIFTDYVIVVLGWKSGVFLADFGCYNNLIIYLCDSAFCFIKSYAA